jgi:hypothetical protein
MRAARNSTVFSQAAEAMSGNRCRVTAGFAGRG